MTYRVFDTEKQKWVKDNIYMNPGSVSIPKEETPRGYMTLEGNLLQWKTLDGETYRTYSL